MKRYFPMLLLLFAQGVLHAQPDPKASSLRLYYVAYQIGHPGAQLAWEKPLWQSVKLKEGKKPGQRWQTLLVSPYIGYHSHVQNHRGLGAGAELAYRYTTKRGLEYQAFVQGGYLHTFLANPTWEYLGNGEFDQINNAGRGSLGYGFGAALGYNAWSRGKAPLAFSARLAFNQPRQATSAMLPSFSAGVHYFLSTSKS